MPLSVLATGGSVYTFNIFVVCAERERVSPRSTAHYSFVPLSVLAAGGSVYTFNIFIVCAEREFLPGLRHATVSSSLERSDTQATNKIGSHNCV